MVPRILLFALVPIVTSCLYLYIHFPWGKYNMGYVSGVYFSNWSVYQAQHFPTDLDVANLSHVFYAFMKIDPQSGKVQLSDPWADIDQNIAGHKGCLGLFHALKEENRHLKVVMSIGGWGTESVFQNTVASPTRLAAFVDSVGELVQTYKLDGVDIDWEYPANKHEGEKLCEMLEMVRAKLDSIHENLELTVAAPASSSHLQYYDVQRMDRSLTFWNIMCYDFSGSGWSSQTACQLNLYGDSMCADSVIRMYQDRGVPVDRIVLGMPMYGRAFYSQDNPGLGGLFDKAMPYPSDTVEYHDIDSEGETYDEKRAAAYTYNQTKRLWITYDNEKCAAAKAKYVRERGLRGGFWWESKGEAKQQQRKLVGAFVLEIGGSGAIDQRMNWI